MIVRAKLTFEATIPGCLSLFVSNPYIRSNFLAIDHRFHHSSQIRQSDAVHTAACMLRTSCLGHWPLCSCWVWGPGCSAHHPERYKLASQISYVFVRRLQKLGSTCARHILSADNFYLVEQSEAFCDPFPNFIPSSPAPSRGMQINL